MNLWRCIPNFVQSFFSSPVVSPSAIFNKVSLQPNKNDLLRMILSRSISLIALHDRGPVKKKKKKSLLDGNPFLKGIVLRTVIKKPRKPNSANRKCVFVKLSNGKQVFAYVPGIGHNLQEHQFVLVQGGRLKDVPGVKLRCVRGKYDLPHVGK